MIIYEALICKRLLSYLERNKLLSPFQATYRRCRSTHDHILTLHEIFLEYRYNKIVEAVAVKDVCFSYSWTSIKPSTRSPATFCFQKFSTTALGGKWFVLSKTYFLKILLKFSWKDSYPLHSPLITVYLREVN